MTTKAIIPILYPARPESLPIQMTVMNGRIEMIRASVDDIPVKFVKNSKGEFQSETFAGIEAAYLHNIEIQLNRMFA